MPRDSDSTGPLVLADIKTVFGDRSTDRLWSTTICDGLTEREGRPWSEWRASKTAEPGPLTKNQLARLLRPFGIRPETIRIGEDRAKDAVHSITSSARPRSALAAKDLALSRVLIRL